MILELENFKGLLERFQILIILNALGFEIISGLDLI